MSPERQLKTIKNIKTLAWFILLFLGILVFVFALFSGSEDVGILKNSPNALPWAALLLITLYAWKKPVTGGIILFLLGLGMVYFFNFSGKNFFLTTFVMTSSIPLLGLILFLCGYYITKRKEDDE